MIRKAHKKGLQGDWIMTDGKKEHRCVVITGSTRGLGLEMAKRFRKKNLNVVINGRDESRLSGALSILQRIESKAEVCGVVGDVTESKAMKELLDTAVEHFGRIDIWINNAGTNQPWKALWELSEEEIDQLLRVDLRGAILGTRLAALQMEQQAEGGMIYNLEGHGSNDAMILGLNMYGTCKRALTYFTKAFAKELEERGSKVKIGRLTPGIMVTDFMTHALGGREEIDLPESTKKFYNIMADRPGEVASFFVRKILGNTKNDAHFQWLTTGKVVKRLLKSPWNKRDFFKE